MARIDKILPQGGGGESEWTDTGTVLHPTENTDDVVIGATSPINSAKLSVDGDSDQTQLSVQGHSTQTNSPVIIEQSDGTEILNLTDAGKLTIEGGLIAFGTSFIFGSGGKSITFQNATNGNNINFRNKNANKAMNFDFPATGGTFRIRSHDGTTGSKRLTMTSNGEMVFNSGLKPNADFIMLGSRNSNVFHMDADEDSIGIRTATPKASLDLQGGLRHAQNSITASYNLTGSDYLIHGDASSNTFSVVLPAASANTTGRTFVVIATDTQAGMNQLSVSPSGTNNLNGANSSIDITTGYEGLVIYGDTATSWTAHTIAAPGGI